MGWQIRRQCTPPTSSTQHTILIINSSAHPLSNQRIRHIWNLVDVVIKLFFPADLLKANSELLKLDQQLQQRWFWLRLFKSTELLQWIHSIPSRRQLGCVLRTCSRQCNHLQVGNSRSNPTHKEPWSIPSRPDRLAQQCRQSDRSRSDMERKQPGSVQSLRSNRWLDAYVKGSASIGHGRRCAHFPLRWWRGLYLQLYGSGR